jgi:hypothetical protein
VTLAVPKINYGLERLLILTAAPFTPTLHHPPDALGAKAANSITPASVKSSLINSTLLLYNKAKIKSSLFLKFCFILC